MAFTHSPGTGSSPLARPSERSTALQFLALGLPLAGVFAVFPFVQLMGWFLAAICHEGGHALAMWFMGCPAMPAISLGGEGASVWTEPSLFIRAFVFLSAFWFLRQWAPARAFPWLAAGHAILYALLAFTPLGDVLRLTSGHLGEVIIASVFLWRAASDEACNSGAERLAYAVVGWYLAGRNVVLGFGLAFSAASRAEYHGNGSFGIENDYIRLGRDVLGAELSTVGLLAGLLCLVIPLGTLGWHFARGRA